VAHIPECFQAWPLKETVLRFSAAFLPLLLATAVPASLDAGTSNVNFEGFPDGTVLTAQYPGLTFSNAIVLTTGVSLGERDFPTHSGTNVASDSGGPITIGFASPVQSFSGFFTYSVPVTIQAYDASNNPVASAVSSFSNNEALSGVSGSHANELLQVRRSLMSITTLMPKARPYWVG